MEERRAELERDLLAIDRDEAEAAQRRDRRNAPAALYRPQGRDSARPLQGEFAGARGSGLQGGQGRQGQGRRTPGDRGAWAMPERRERYVKSGQRLLRNVVVISCCEAEPCVLPARLSSFVSRVPAPRTDRTSIYKGLPEPERLSHNFCQNPPNHASIATHTH